ncbi:cation transporter [Novipirellula rosea]|uniref:Cation efflux protein transmembrane domain-containing protein n=1 Tax=Novipirellula rosea TaxID=1031540 RepID=A0ABP8NIN2_9BACT
MTDCGCEFEPTDADQRRTLRVVLAINAIMFVAEITVGILASSTGLAADSLDMLSDASVYAISLYAVGRGIGIRRTAASINGSFQVLLGIVVLLEAGRRFIVGGEPLGMAMIAVGCIALLANVICFWQLWKHRKGDVNLRSSLICSANDVIANTGVIVSGGLVLLLETQLPDLVIGVLIAAVVIRGGMKILREVRESG